jgi:hypothetical protein
MPTVTQYEDARAEIVFAFSDALRAQRAFDASGECGDCEQLNAAFEVAKRYGWDWEADEDFASWCLRATPQEICTEGLRQALAGVRL